MGGDRKLISSEGSNYLRKLQKNANKKKCHTQNGPSPAAVQKIEDKASSLEKPVRWSVPGQTEYPRDQTLTRNLTKTHHPLVLLHTTLRSHHPLGHPLTIHSTNSSSTRHSTRRNHQTAKFDSETYLVAQGYPCAVSQNVFVA